MAISAAVVSAGVGLAGSLIIGNQAKQQQKGSQAAINRSLQASIAATPPPPSVSAEQGQAASAMSAAAARQRKIASGAGGYSQNILTSPLGAPPAVVQRKTLLGS